MTRLVPLPILPSSIDSLYLALLGALRAGRIAALGVNRTSGTRRRCRTITEADLPSRVGIIRIDRLTTP